MYDKIHYNIKNKKFKKKRTVRNMQGESVKMKNRKSGEKDIIIVPI